MGHRLPHRASLTFRILVVIAVACSGLVVAAPATAVSDTGAPEAAPSVAAAERVGVNDCYSTDNGDPRLVKFRYGPGRVNVIGKRAVVRFWVRARDTGGPGPASGVRTVRVWFGSPGADEPGIEGHDLNEGADGWWAGSVTVPRKTPHRVWPVHGLDLRDRAGNVKSYSRGALRTLTGRSLAVSITTARDRTAPHLTAFSVTPKVVDTREAVRYVTFTARMVDVQSDIADYGVGVYGSGDTSWLSPETGTISLDKVAGSRHLFRARVPVPRWVGNRTWRTTGVGAWNSADVLAGYSRRQLAERAFHGDFSVVSDTDQARAQARSFDVSAKALDVRTSDAQVSFRVHATDAGSGVHSIFISTESEELWVGLTRMSGTRHDGVWTGTANVRHCRTPTSIWRLQLYAYDRNGNYEDALIYETENLAARGWQSRIRVTGGDHERPQVTVPARVRPAGPIRMRFTEAVQGIHRANVRVQRIRANGSLGPTLPGTWRCFDRRGDRANCRTGSVREARFRPGRPLRLGARYAVTLNPEHHLGITDLAGNPLRQTVRRLRVNQ